MSDVTTASNGVTSQYAAQVAGDLERNLKEQERIAGEIAVLQGQLAALEQDRSVLLNVQQALGVEPAVPPAAAVAVEPAAAAPGPVAEVPAPRGKKQPATGTAQRKRTGKSAPPARKQDGRKKAARTTTARTTEAGATTAPTTEARATTARTTGAGTTAAEPAKPSLVSLVREHLAGQNEPRSAAEIAQWLDKHHPERGIKTTVVRSTLEGLVARNQAHRSKQGTSVFYTSPDAPEPAADHKQEPEQEKGQEQGTERGQAQAQAQDQGQGQEQSG
ncbi:hypothetical protein [Streptomyces sp. NPDC003247]|uniref:hypothetical protein n=1 Tax=Streptomyces sp. NPDC003247 TaxID=3364677 RepID=UPI0036AE9B5B